MNITSTYEHFEQTHPEKVAIRTENGEITFQEWARLVRQAVTWFQSKKSKNRRVAIVAENTLGSLVAIAGAARAGWTAIPIDPRWTVGEVQERVKMVHPDVLFAGNQLDLVIEVSFEQINSWLSHIKALEESKECVRDAALPFYIGFTSGSTGNPKAFIRSHQSWIESFHCNISDFEMTRDEVVLIPGTIFHSLFLYGALSALYLGQTIYFMRKFIPEKAARVLHDFPITAMYAVPTMFQGLMKQGLKIVKPISFISSGAKWEDHAKEEMVRLFPEGRLYEFYGASETSYITVLTPEHLAEKPGSVGKACKGVAIQVRGAAGEVLPPGEAGTIYVKSSMLFSGYIMDSMLENVQDADGWVTVHDAGYLDEDGFLYLVGREKNMIISGGINIFPEEIEAVVKKHPNVTEAVVVGMPDSYWGEVLLAFYSGQVAPAELKRHCRQYLSAYKVPRIWKRIDSFPYTSSGKVARQKLKEEVQYA